VARLAGRPVEDPDRDTGVCVGFQAQTSRSSRPPVPGNRAWHNDPDAKEADRDTACDDIFGAV
jgi:hypothetical protein